MSVRRLVIAAVILFAATYLKLFLPLFATDVLPAVQKMLAEQQIALHVPEAWMSWVTLH